jgi:putative membrane protein
MTSITRTLIWVVAGLHLAFMIAEMFFWETLTPLLHVYDENAAGITAPVGRNMGLYNGILAGGLIGSLVAPELSESNRRSIATYLLVAIIAAGVLGGLTIKWTIPLFQSLPALSALYFCLLQSRSPTPAGGSSLH